MRKFSISFMILAVLALVTYANAGQEMLWDFEKETLGKVPSAWKIEATNPRGDLATWNIVLDSKNGGKTQVLGMTKANDDFGGTFNICWLDGVQTKDVDLDVSFKAISGVEDQGGGLIWRVQDKDNYYIARANPLENNFCIYYVKDGARKTLANVRVDVAANQWHTMRILHRDNHVEGYLDGKRYLEWEDSTFPDAGGVGLWTKADAVTYFDNFKVNF